MKKKSILHILIFLTLCSSPLFSQNRNTAGHADYLHMQYRFNDAIDIYKQLLKQSTDSSAKSDIEKKLINSVNGKNMLKYACVFVAFRKRARGLTCHSNELHFP